MITEELLLRLTDDAVQKIFDKWTVNLPEEQRADFWQDLCEFGQAMSEIALLDISREFKL